MRKIRKGDTVIALTGKDKGKQGKVLQLLVAKNRACVEGINLVKKHVKPKPQKGVTGGIVARSGYSFNKSCFIQPSYEKR